MTLPRRAAVLLACFLAAGAVAGQSPSPSAAPFAGDDRAARVAERYQAMLATNPAEGMALDRLWKMYEERNATAALLESYRRATDAADKPADALIYGYLLKRAGRLDEAAGSFTRAARLEPDSPLPLVAQADLALAQAKPAEAAASLEQALAKVPATDRRRTDLLLKLGDAWLAAGQPLQAAEAWETLLATDPDNLAVHGQLAVNYEKNGLPERAITHYEYIEAHADPAGRAAALRELGRLHEARGEFDAARSALEGGLALTARDNWLHGELQNSLIRLYQRAGKAAELEARWRAEVEATPRDLGGYLRLVALAEAQGDPAAARIWLEKIVALAPRDREQSLKLARLLTDAGENERAAALYDALLKLQPGNLDLILARAGLDLQMGHPADASARVEARVAQNPADESVTVPALQFFLSHRLDDAALKVLAAAVARQPDTAEPAAALAKFYFARGRAADAHAALDRLAQQPGDPPARARRWIAAADCYRDSGLADDALRCWQEALALQPGSNTALAAVGELLLARGDLPAGIDQLERALRATPEGPARDEIDRKLFQALSDHSPPEEFGPTGAARWHSGVVGPPGGPVIIGLPAGAMPHRIPADSLAKPPARPLQDYLSAMDRAAHEKPTAAAYLRLARWLQWANRPHDAGAAAEAALALEPGNIPAHELLADTSAALHNHLAAIKRLGEIAALDPTRKPAVTKRIADLLLEDGEFDGALALLDRRAQEQPGSVEALTDLALAQQRADRWFDALATWERAYALPRLSPAQRANLRQPMVSAYEHLGQFARAASLLQAAVDAQDDLATRQDLFRELAAFCQAHALSVWLEGVYKDRLAAQPQDYFAMTALAELQKAAGDPRGAYQLLDRAYYSSPDPSSALRILVADAESLGEGKAAIAHQRRLIGLPGQATAENLEKLATLEEADLDPEATQVWERVAARFSRDTGALGAAADYFATAGNAPRARELLTQVATLDPGDFRRMYQLAQLDAQAGDAAASRACLEAILARTRPETASDPLVPPRELDPAADPTEFVAAASRTAAHAPTGTPDASSGPASGDGDERAVRLQAIGMLSRTIFAGNGPANTDERRRWLERWHVAAAAGARSEPLAAFFRGGQKDAVMELTASWLNQPEGRESERPERIFLLAGLRMENYPPLARWVWDGEEAARSERVSSLVDTLQYFLSTGGRPSPQLVAQLFPAEIKSRTLLWQTATTVFADKRWFPQAVELGERAIGSAGGNIAGDVFQLAQWELDIGRIDAARRLLQRAIEQSEGTAFDTNANNAVFADLRAYYLMLPPAERASFAAGYLQRIKGRGSNPVHAMLATALLHGLGGDEAAACRELDRIVEMRLLSGRQDAESVDARRWNYLFACGTQLQAWNLDRLAAHVWRRGLEEASAFDKRDPEVHNILSEIRLHQLVTEVATAADPQEVRERVGEYLRANPSVVTMAAAASALMSAGQHAAAIQIYERLHRDVPAEADYPRALLFAHAAEGGGASLHAVLQAMLEGGMPAGDPAGRFDLLTRRASALEGFGDADGACRLLLDARRTSPHSLVVLQTLARLLERNQRLDDAAAIWREASKYDSSLSSLEALAAVELSRGRRQEAFAVVRDAPEPAADQQGWWLGRRVSVYLATGHVPEAVELCRAALRAGRTDGMVEAGSLLAQQGQRPAARELLAAAVAAAREPAMKFLIQHGLVQFCYAKPDVPLEDFLREMRRLEEFAKAAPGQRPQYERDRYRFAVDRGATDWLKSELKREWDDGRGEIAAGDQLADLYLETKRADALRDLVATIDARPNLPEQTLFSLEVRLIKAGHAPWALPISERLCRRFPQNADYTAARARALWQAGQHDAAIAVLDVLEAQGVFRDEYSGRVALLYAELGDRARAIASLERTVGLDPLAIRTSALYGRLAELYLQDGRREDAYRLLAVAYRNPAQGDMGPLLDYLEAAGGLEVNAADDLPGGELPLTFFRRAQLLETVCERLERSGRGAAAFRLAAAHPELLPEVPALVDRLRRAATPEQLPILAKALENAMRETETPAEPLPDELAKIYVRQAELAAATQPPNQGVAVNFLTQADELAPGDFAVARPLAAAFHGQHEDARAANVLKPFLQEDALPTERSAAQQVLGLK